MKGMFIAVLLLICAGCALDPDRMAMRELEREDFEIATQQCVQAGRIMVTDRWGDRLCMSPYDVRRAMPRGTL